MIPYSGLVVSLSLLTACSLPFLAELYFNRFNAFGSVTALEPDPPPSAEVVVLAAVSHIPLLLRLSLPTGVAPSTTSRPRESPLPEQICFAIAAGARAMLDKVRVCNAEHPQPFTSPSAPVPFLREARQRAWAHVSHPFPTCRA